MTCRISLILLLYIVVICECEMYQDHVISWTAKDKKSTVNQTFLRVREGDNIIFNCPKDYGGSEQLYWTRNIQEYNNCILTPGTHRRKLLDCGDHRSGPDFLLKVSQFSEISQLPTFHANSPVYFISQPEFCAKGNLKLAVYKRDLNGDKLKSDLTKQSAMPRLLNDPAHIDNTRIPENVRNQSLWMRYRFLFIPGILGLITLLGIQTLICALWRRRNTHQNQSNERGFRWNQLCCRIQCSCRNANNNCLHFNKSSSRQEGKSPSSTYLNNCNKDFSERLKPKHVEFSSEHIRSSKSHSHMGIGTMPKHLISQSKNKQMFIIPTNPSCYHDRLQTNHMLHENQSVLYYNTEFARNVPPSGFLIPANCAHTMHGYGSDGEKQACAINAQACIFMDDCATLVLPLSNANDSSIVMQKARDFNDKVINISV